MFKKVVFAFLGVNLIIFLALGLLVSWTAAQQILGILIVGYTVGLVISLIVAALTTPRGPCIG